MKKIIDSIFGIFETEKGVPEMKNPPAPPERIETKSDYYDGGGKLFSPWYPVNTYYFDGEKTAGELGAPIDLLPEHRGLRFRAYEAQLKSDIVKIITGKFFKWVIGSGLKLQSEPAEKALSTEGVTEDLSEFRKVTEARFKVFCESSSSDYSGINNLHKIAAEAHKTAFLSGDALVILRVENKKLNIQVVDGSEVVSPLLEQKYYDEALERGNIIKHGIEVNKRNQHVAFYVRTYKNDLTYSVERVEAKGKESGMIMAWMIYGDKHRSSHLRGIPVISAILEKVEKLDRYTEASVGGAEERAKIAFSIEHNSTSTGENPMISQMRENLGTGTKTEDPYGLADKLGKNITKTTGKQTFNMPIGSKLNALDSKQEDNYEPFFNAVFVQLCAAIDIPPEVAIQKYSSNYSASRAAINGWGYIVDIHRKDFSFAFYKPIYRVWLITEVLNGKIKSPALLKAILDDDDFVIECFISAKFTGVNMPHIDPLKEVKAIREMLGDQSKGQMPLISHDRASEELNQGEWADNFLKWNEEMKNYDKIKPFIEKKETITDNNKENESGKN